MNDKNIKDDKGNVYAESKVCFHTLKEISKLVLPPKDPVDIFDDVIGSLMIATLASVVLGRPVESKVVLNGDEGYSVQTDDEAINELAALEQEEILKLIIPALSTKLTRQHDARHKGSLGALLFDALREAGKDAANSA